MCSKKYKKILMVVWFALGLLGCDVSKNVNESNDNIRTLESQLTAVEIKKPEKKEIDIWVNKQVYNLNETELKDIDYLHNSIDLNGDGKLETFVLIQDIDFCNTKGCSSYLFDEKGNMIGNTMLVDEPIFISNKSAANWKDIIVRSGKHFHVLEFDGETYPADPSLQPVIMRDENKAKQLVIATSTYQQNGYKLEPVDLDEILTPFEEYVYRFKYYDEPYIFYKATVNLDSKNIKLAKYDM